MNSKIPLISQSHVKERGIFYVGGKKTGNEQDQYYCNQMYVEVYTPQKKTHPYPIIMLHGAGQTAVNWLITPDGRMGWADYFIAHGYEVYLAEQPARGRSAWHPEVNGKTMHHTIVSLERFTSNQGKWPQSKKHTQWPEGEEALEQFLSSQVEYLPSNRDSQQLELEVGRELLKLIGPAILMTHSQAGPFGWLLADDQPELVKGIVALEPSGPPFSNDVTNPTVKNYGIADLPLHFEPEIAGKEDLQVELWKASEEGLNNGWIMKEPYRKLPRLQGIPILLMVSESSYHAGYDHLTSKVLEQSGVEHDFVRLENIGIHGNGHMMMLEKNNLEIAQWIAGWLEKKGE